MKGEKEREGEVKLPEQIVRLRHCVMLMPVAGIVTTSAISDRDALNLAPPRCQQDTSLDRHLTLDSPMPPSVKTMCRLVPFLDTPKAPFCAVPGRVEDCMAVAAASRRESC